MPKVSILMASCNGEKYIRQSLDSIINQTFSDFELIVINDASSDKTLEILKKYAKKDSRIYFYSNEKNEGLTVSLNIALKYISPDSQLICRMDDDDICMPNRLEIQIKYFQQHKDAGVVGSNAFIIDNENRIIGKRKVPTEHDKIMAALPRYNPMIHSSVMIKRDVLKKTNGYNEKFRTSQDYELWFRLAASGIRFANIPENLLKYRETRSAQRRKSMKYRLNDFKIRKLGYRLLKLPFYKYIWLAFPLLLGCVPMPIYKLLRKADPRRIIEINF